MTVNQLLAELRKLQRAGRGDQTVFIHRKGDTYCMPAKEVTAHHKVQMGHVVISSEVP